jgi:hypothetical protein
MKRPDLNDTLRDEGISGVRARMDGAKIYQLNGKAPVYARSEV